MIIVSLLPFIKTDAQIVYGSRFMGGLGDSTIIGIILQTNYLQQ